MDMQDKELDKLFQSQLNDYEIEPPAKVWQGINEHLDAGNKKRRLMPFLSVAAAVILLVTAGILFIPKQIKTNDKPKNDQSLVKNAPVVKPAPIIIASPAVKPAPAQNKNKHREVIAPVSQLAAVKKGRRNANAGYALKQVTSKPKETEHNEEPMLASAKRDNDITIPVVPDNTTPLAVKQTIDDAPKFVSSPVVAATAVANLPVAQKQPVKKHRIRSFGDVLNVVIAAVDKRDKKVIQFSNTDGDDATITGVNLGIIKINKNK